MANVTCDTALCVYCGWDADTVDHVLPRAWSGDAGRAVVPKVPACKDCNVRIGNRHAPTLGERRQMVWESLERKHRKLLRCAGWSDDEMADFGPRLRAEMEAREAKRRMVRYRLDNLARDDEDPIMDWLLHASAYGDNFARRLLDRRDAEALAARCGL